MSLESRSERLGLLCFQPKVVRALGFYGYSEKKFFFQLLISSKACATPSQTEAKSEAMVCRIALELGLRASARLLKGQLIQYSKIPGTGIVLFQSIRASQALRPTELLLL